MSFLPYMAFLELLAILLLFSVLIPVFKNIQRFQRHTTVIQTNWPILGTLLPLLVNIHRHHDYVTEVLSKSGGSFMFKGPWFTNMNLLFTTDPLDIHHILSKNFNNYPKGDKYHKMFAMLGDGILNADGEIWKMSHKVVFSILKHAKFQTMAETIIWNKVESRLLPVLDSICGSGTQLDLQDILQRFTFDTVCKLLFDIDYESLSLDLPCIPLARAFTDAEEAIMLRCFLPSCFWKLQQTFSFGYEKKLSDACKNIDQFVYKWLDNNQREYNDNMNHEGETFTFFTALKRELRDQIGTSMDTTKFLRDTMVNLMAAGKDTISSALSWFFYLLAKNPTVEEKILEEILTYLEVNASKRWRLEDLEKLVYLHGALCESMRLYPPVPFNHKSPLKPEILPSGHQVDQHTIIMLSFYSMGRMKSVWGEDCMEFRPERWITSSGRIKHEPSYKIPTFNAGPRTCLGKNMALSHLKILASTIIYRYRIQLVDGHLVIPTNSVVLPMKHGLKVWLNRRNELN